MNPFFINMGRSNFLKIIILATLLSLLPLLTKSNYYFSVMIFVGLNALMAIGLCLLMGFAGQISLGHAAFYGLGAYISAILTKSWGLHPVTTLLFAALATGFLAWLIAMPIFKLKGHFLAMATLGLGIIIYMVFNNLEITGGPSGIDSIPYFSLPLPFLGKEIVFDKDVKVYYLIWALVVPLLWFSLNIVNSRVGRALRSIHGSEDAASAMGVNTEEYKIRIFVLSAMYASIAGSIYAHYLTYVSPSSFGFMFSIELVVMVVIGGMGSIWGALMGAFVVTVLSDFLRNVMSKIVKGATGEVEIVAFGIILMVIMIFWPGGLAQGFSLIWRRVLRKKEA
jgi:branched-chain amino acid transport system permease protein